MLTSEHYNLLALPSSAVARAIVDLGHEVGLHYDVAAIEQIGLDAERQLQNQAMAFADLTGQPVRSISRHNPSLGGDDPFAHSDRFINAYDPRFTRDIVYFSDSCGAWRDAAATALNPGGVLPSRLQLLIHPIFWAEEPGDRWSRLDRHIESETRRMESEAERVRSLWRSHSGVAEHDTRSSAGKRRSI